MTALGILWFILIAVLMAGYFVLDGFDLGVGVLYPFVAKEEKEKMQCLKAIGPVWDGNEVWVLTAGGALFAAFAPAYATSFSGFYLAIMLVLFGLILRAVSLEFRYHGDDMTRLWDSLFFVGSLLPALLFGVALGNIVQGLPLNANGDYTGSFFALLNPFALLCGVLGLVHMLLQGSCWLSLKAPAGSELRERAAALRGKLAVVAAAVFAVVTVLFLILVMPNMSYGVGCMPLAVVAAVIYLAGVLGASKLGKQDEPASDLKPFLLVSLGAVALVIILGATLFPNLVPATDPFFSLTIANSAATDATLLPMTIIAVIGVPIVLVYHVIIYRSFRGRVK
ncbi:MAG: cytochrome d ubiquinol oxidase subunit II [Coriobacteriales bacterium]